MTLFRPNNTFSPNSLGFLQFITFQHQPMAILKRHSQHHRSYNALFASGTNYSQSIDQLQYIYLTVKRRTRISDTSASST